MPEEAGRPGPELPGWNGRPPNGGNGRAGGGQPPTGTDGQPPSGQRPPNGGAFNSAQAQKLREALKKCGVTLPGRGQNGPPQQQGTTPSDTNAS